MFCANTKDFHVARFEIGVLIPQIVDYKPHYFIMTASLRSFPKQSRLFASWCDPSAASGEPNLDNSGVPVRRCGEECRIAVPVLLDGINAII